MLYRTILYFSGLGIAGAGGINIVAYLNVMAMGKGFGDYLLYILKRPECYLFPVGLVIITYAIFGFHAGE